MAASAGPERPHNREIENEMLRPPAQEGEPPRPATEPPQPVQNGSEATVPPGAQASGSHILSALGKVLRRKRK